MSSSVGVATTTTSSHSIVELCFDEGEENETTTTTSDRKCGYCGGSGGSVSVGMWAHSLTPAVYQHLINHGWRRSGKYVYRPRNEVTCCPMYTIRCDALKFTLTKSMKKTIRRVNNFHWDDDNNGNENNSDEDCDVASGEGDCGGGGADVGGVEREVVRPAGASVLTNAPELKTEPRQQERASSPSSASPPPPPPPPAGGGAATSHHTPQKPPPPNNTSTSKPRKPPKDNSSKSLSELLESHGSLEIERVLVGTPEFQAGEEEEHALYVKYQVAVHNDKPSDVKFKQFKRFLIDTPIIATTPPSLFGTYHVRYYIKSSDHHHHRHLIAVGVVDVLPMCVSSVYFFYDPRGRSKLSLGTYGALQEIEMVRDLQLREHPGIQWYYMGYYIHSCSKMRYKGKFSPSHLLCDKTHTWVDIQAVITLLQQNKYVVFNKELYNSRGSVHQDVNRVHVMTESDVGVMTLLRFPQYNKERGLLQRFADLIGSSSILPHIIVYRASS